MIKPRHTIKPRPSILKIPFYLSGASKLKKIKKPIKLSSNENPLGPTQKAIDAFVSVKNNLGTYPDSSHKRLRMAIAETHDIDENRIICGAGSDEIIHFLCQCYAGAGDEVIHTEHGFLMYKISALATGAKPVSVAESNRRADISKILGACNDRTKLIFLANPNNPTGTLISSNEINHLLNSIPEHTLLVLDGAYAEYIDNFDSGLSLSQTRDNLFILRTFSKMYGLASLRIGWGYGSEYIVNTLLRVRPPFNISLAAQESAAVAMMDTDYVESCRSKNLVLREKLTNELRNIGLNLDKSFANFVLARFPNSQVASLADDYLKENGILVRKMNDYNLASALRISVGTGSDCDRVVKSLKQFQGRIDAL